LLACPSCGTLVHSAELKSLAQAGALAETSGELASALGAWRSALELLPASTAQHAKILAKVQALSARVQTTGTTTAEKSDRAGSRRRGIGAWLAGLGATGALLFKFKAIPLFLLGKGKLLLLGLTQAKTFFSMAISVGVYAMVFGWWFAFGLVVSIYVHEMGHVAALRLYGIPASAPMFVPGLGAFVRLKQRPATAGEDARVGLAGPIWGAGAALVALLFGKANDVPVLVAIGSVGAMINLFNLLPVWQLDGARAFVALTKRQRFIVSGVLWLLALFARDFTLFLLAIVATGRALTTDRTAPNEGDRGVLATFVVLAIGLTLIMTSAGELASLTPK
jgi:Zn-dependent protease